MYQLYRSILILVIYGSLNTCIYIYTTSLHICIHIYICVCICIRIFVCDMCLNTSHHIHTVCVCSCHAALETAIADASGDPIGLVCRSWETFGAVPGVLFGFSWIFHFSETLNRYDFLLLSKIMVKPINRRHPRWRLPHPFESHRSPSSCTPGWTGTPTRQCRWDPSRGKTSEERHLPKDAPTL